MEAEAEIHEEAKEMGSQTPKQTVEARVPRPPHNYVAIVKDSDVPIETSSLDMLCDQLFDGVVLQQGQRKYWVDRHLNKNCFMVFARELAITWADSDQYWGWTTVKESGNVDVEVAELRSVCLLEISGKFRTIMLSPKTLYEVSLVASMTESSQGWGVPVNINLTLPDASKLESMESLQDMPRRKWKNILMGEFMTSCENIGEITFRISECSANWKRGLVVKGVAFRPKN
ncbi:protein PHLOEM PROTEIN 2-LIKE A1-like [Syzygium oleosum]|uniref:protein PHLOEM PROTEIN 2-LIKE A1-like n=1 Tax=Syzygium oleosum TaxID=219896 RepID=UPI0011D19598|nr:protein PHLOEM PROTEIN 2-LIKE A1-like [Syzygium oleosum]